MHAAHQRAQLARDERAVFVILEKLMHIVSELGHASFLRKRMYESLTPAF